MQLSNDGFREHRDYHQIPSLNFPVTTVQSRLEILPIYIMHVLIVLTFLRGLCTDRDCSAADYCGTYQTSTDDEQNGLCFVGIAAGA